MPIKVAQRDLWIYSAIFVDILSIFTHISLKNPRYLEKSCTKKEDQILFSSLRQRDMLMGQQYWWATIKVGNLVEIQLYLQPILLFLKDNQICRLYRLYIYISCYCNHLDIIISIGQIPNQSCCLFFYIRQRDLQIIQTIYIHILSLKSPSSLSVLAISPTNLVVCFFASDNQICRL